MKLGCFDLPERVNNNSTVYFVCNEWAVFLKVLLHGLNVMFSEMSGCYLLCITGRYLIHLNMIIR